MNIHKVTFILLIVGGLAWGLEALNFGIWSYVPSWLSTVIFALVGLSAIYEVFSHKGYCRSCSSQGAM
jgi:uncharacterized membrane protein YuzA (DUF378 family)